jgi:hypothetical protein
VADRSAHSDAAIDAAIQALSEPGRLDAAQRLVVERAPQLQRILDAALHEAGWFGQAQQSSVREATDQADPEQRLQSVHALLVEETRVSMLVGVAVGYELAQTLMHPTNEETD